MMKISKLFPLGLLTALALLTGASTAPAQNAAKVEVAGVSFTPPTGWKAVPPPSPMRKAQFAIKTADGKDGAEVVFFVFPSGEAGSVAANVERWYKKFTEDREKINAKSESVTVGKSKVTYVQAEGTYDNAIPGGAPDLKPNYGLLGAIVETSIGNIFIRFTGPKELAKSTLPDFKKMVESGLK